LKEAAFKWVTIHLDTAVTTSFLKLEANSLYGSGSPVELIELMVFAMDGEISVVGSDVVSMIELGIWYGLVCDVDIVVV
jgi:hypothetical protein